MSTSIRPAKICLAVTGGVAAFKAAALTSALAQQGHQIQVVLTQAGDRFVGAATFAALSGRPVVTNLFDPAFPLGAHIELSREYDLLCVAPATANFLAKAAHGLSDCLASTLYLCFTGPVLIAPAMNCEMWEKSAVQRNVAQLANDGVHVIQPAAGWLSCRTLGIGRMAQPETLADAINRQLTG